MSSRGMRGRRRMVAHLCDKFKCLKGLTLPCVCAYLQIGETPLTGAAHYGHIEVVRHLGSSGADVNKAADVSVRGWTPLTGAALHGRIEVVRHLVSSGADVNKADKVSVCLHWLW